MHEKSPDNAHTDAKPRRNFLVEFGAIATSLLAGAVPAVVGGLFAFTPLLKKKNVSADNASDTFLKVGTKGSMTPGGPPQMFKVTGIKVDAWTTYPETEIGAVYVQMQTDGSLTCFNASCPHLGCAVNYKSDVNEFICPCHDSAFSCTGERTNDIPPRDLDALKVELRNDQEIWVKFENFRAGTHEQELV